MWVLILGFSVLTNSSCDGTIWLFIFNTSIIMRQTWWVSFTVSNFTCCWFLSLEELGEKARMNSCKSGTIEREKSIYLKVVLVTLFYVEQGLMPILDDYFSARIIHKASCSYYTNIWEFFWLLNNQKWSNHDIKIFGFAFIQITNQAKIVAVWVSYDSQRVHYPRSSPAYCSLYLEFIEPCTW